MLVKATQKLYYGLQIRQPGEIFELVEYTVKGEDGKDQKVSPEEQFAPECMETPDGSPAPSVKRPGQNVSVDDKEDPNKPFNPNVGDNVKSMEEIELAHGGEQDAAKVAEATGAKAAPKAKKDKGVL